MAEKSGFFNSVNGDRKYKADFFAEYFSSFIGNGIFPNPSTNLQVISNDSMAITIKQGKAWINGRYYHNDSDFIEVLENADGVLNRIDRVALRYDKVNREIKIVVKKGVFASSPVALELQRDADAYELGIADIYIANGAVSISQANITDTRLDSNLCGVVTGVIDQVDVTTLYNQYSAAFEAKESEFEQDFNTWFATIQGALSGDVAGNLLNLINQNSTQLNEIANDIGTETLPTTAQDLKGAIAEVFTSGNNVKNDTVNALLSVDNSLPITTESMWADIITNVGNINTSNIKSIQRGVGDGIITIEEVDLNCAVPILHSYVSLYNGQSDRVPYIEIIDSTSIKIESLDNDISTKESWQVIEFENVKSLQSGVTNCSSGSVEVNIDSIDLNKSILFYSNKATMYGLDNSALNSLAYLSTPDTLHIEGYKTQFYWYVVEFN